MADSPTDLGYALDPRVVLTVCGPLPLQLLHLICDHEAIDRAEQERLVRIDAAAGDLVSLRAAKSTLGTAESLRITQVIAASVAAVELPDVAPDVSLRLAELLEVANVYDLVILRDAARAALVMGDATAALRAARFGLAHDPASLELLHLQAMALESLGRHGAATGLDATQVGMHDPAWLGRWASNLFLSTGRIVAPKQLPLVEDERHELDAALVWIQALEGNVAVVAESVNRIIDDPRSSSQAVVWACVAGAVPAALDGRSQIALAMLGHCRSVFDEVADQLSPFAELQIGLVEALVFTRLGKMAHAASLAERQIQTADSPFLAAVWSFFAGISRRESGDFELGLAQFKIGFSEIDSDPFGLIAWAQSEAAVCTAMINAAPVGAIPNEPSEGHGLYTACIARNSAWIRAAQSDVDAAIEDLDRSIEIAKERGQNVHLALALFDLARFGEPHRASTMLTELTEVDASLVKGAALAVRTLAEGNAELLIPAAQAMRELGMVMQADEFVHQARHTAARAADLSQVARFDLLTLPRRRPTPIFAQYPETPPQLTERERDVARRCAAGATSRQIGTELEISTRTVDNLLGRVYRKCSFGGRRELQSWYGSSSLACVDPLTDRTTLAN